MRGVTLQRPATAATAAALTRGPVEAVEVTATEGAVATAMGPALAAVVATAAAAAIAMAEEEVETAMVVNTPPPLPSSHLYQCTVPPLLRLFQAYP